MKITLRNKKTEEKYQKFKKTWKEGFCPLCHLEPLKYYGSFILVENAYPVSKKLMQTHHMIILKAHHKCLTQNELIELEYIKRNYLDGKYGCLVENFDALLSIKSHWHAHLWVFKDVKKGVSRYVLD